MTKRIARIMVSLIPSLLYAVFFGWLLFDVASHGGESGDIFIVIGELLALVSAVLVIICRFDLIQHFKYFIVTFFGSALAIVLTWAIFASTEDEKWLYFSLLVMLFFDIDFAKRRRKIKEIVAFSLLNPIVYYTAVYMWFLSAFPAVVRW